MFHYTTIGESDIRYNKEFGRREGGSGADRSNQPVPGTGVPPEEGARES